MGAWHTIRAAALGLLICATPAHAEGWAQFYVPSQRPAPSTQGHVPRGDMGVCIREILAAQVRHGIPDNLLLAIGLQEAGTRRGGQFTVWPYAVNAAGTGRLFDTRQAALNWVAERQNAGVRSIDVGCMQINLRWHPDAFTSPAQGFDPRVNVDYAARFLMRLYRQTGNWLMAAGSYHSFEPEFRDIYLARLQKNISAANARFPEFVALAGSSGTHALPARRAPAQRTGRKDPGAPVARATWGARLGGDANARMTLYSADEIQPVLPNFKTVTSETAG